MPMRMKKWISRRQIAIERESLSTKAMASTVTDDCEHPILVTALLAKIGYQTFENLDAIEAALSAFQRDIGVYQTWDVKYKHISGFIFHPIFILKRRHGGQTFGESLVKSECILSSLSPVYPPYKSWVKKKSSRTLNLI